MIMKTLWSAVTVTEQTHPRWVAPEMMRSNELSKASDVYSFAIVMYEALTWRMPYYAIKSPLIYMRVGIEEERPFIPPEGDLPGSPGGKRLDLYIELMKECWDPKPDKRPTFDQIAKRLKVQQSWAKLQPHVKDAGMPGTVVDKLRKQVEASKAAAAAAAAAAEAQAHAADAAGADPAASPEATKAAAEAAAAAQAAAAAAAALEAAQAAQAAPQRPSPPPTPSSGGQSNNTPMLTPQTSLDVLAAQAQGATVASVRPGRDDAPGYTGLQTIADKAALLTIQEAAAEGKSVSTTAPASLHSSLNGGGGGGASSSLEIGIGADPSHTGPPPQLGQNVPGICTFSSISAAAVNNAMAAAALGGGGIAAGGRGVSTLPPLPNSPQQAGGLAAGSPARQAGGEGLAGRGLGHLASIASRDDSGSTLGGPALQTISTLRTVSNGSTASQAAAAAVAAAPPANLPHQPPLQAQQQLLQQQHLQQQQQQQQQQQAAFHHQQQQQQQQQQLQPHVSLLDKLGMPLAEPVDTNPGSSWRERSRQQLIEFMGRGRPRRTSEPILEGGEAQDGSPSGAGGGAGGAQDGAGGPHGAVAGGAGAPGGAWDVRRTQSDLAGLAAGPDQGYPAPRASEDAVRSHPIPVSGPWVGGGLQQGGQMGGGGAAQPWQQAPPGQQHWQQQGPQQQQQQQHWQPQQQWQHQGLPPQQQWHPQQQWQQGPPQQHWQQQGPPQHWQQHQGPPQHWQQQQGPPQQWQQQQQQWQQGPHPQQQWRQPQVLEPGVRVVSQQPMSGHYGPPMGLQQPLSHGLPGGVPRVNMLQQQPPQLVSPGQGGQAPPAYAQSVGPASTVHSHWPGH
ncbi:hypothetical protein MNEG_11523 [Monoraphidium neglectum]|uniref:Protein kinase domain-containing protein n=1 Tax=Monoraphidium neglectum TaxID=145388 RepID=A0A0D2KKY5_9CHLO|nr:hypothetical protein MNEG_11523 [Monoraphidium neglectum]KIY96438.1 hypothetical protein MNEG_11523 [Monoraphidium neglectum]|eukprot:XP_013895458.1 hypothetical protein MNEG_11523 [Monoraphidium neglectum]